MTLRGPSTIFATIEALRDILALVSYPPLLGTAGEDLNTAGVQFLFGTMFEQPPRETVNLTGIVDDDVARWDGLGVPSKRHTFSTLIVVITNVPNRTAEEAWTRLRSLTETIEGTLRDHTTGAPVIPESLALLGVYQWTVSSIDTEMGAIPDVGFVASARITVSISADY